MEYLDPTDSGLDEAIHEPAPIELAGKVVAFVNNGWTCMSKIGARIASSIGQLYGVRELRFYGVARNKAPTDDVLERVMRECDAAIVGLAN